MKHYIDFINAKNLAQNSIVKDLNCSLQEAKILQFMAKSLLNNQNNFLVSNVIEKTFLIKGAESTKYLRFVKSLLNLEYITLTGGSGENIMLLELLSAYVALSPHFLKILENGRQAFELPKIAPYNSDLEYLKDEFLKISLLEKLALLRRNQSPNSKILTQTKLNLASITACIDERLSITSKKLRVLAFLKPFHLNNEEKIVFLALLREEYYGENDQMREMSALIDLISSDESARIANKAIFGEKATLLESGLIDYDDDILSPFESAVARSFYIPESILQKITAPKSRKTPKISIDSLLKRQDIFELITPKEHLGAIILPPKTRETIDFLIKQLDSKVVSRLKSWGIKDGKRGIDAKIIFYGHSGTGKTLTAYGLSNALKKPILSLDCSKIISMYVGESEKNVRKIFDTYKDITNEAKKDMILLLDEADQFLSQRSVLGGSSVDKMYNQMQNIFLEQIEKFDGILIATTNLIDNIDQAFSRRFNYKIEFLKPDLAQRREIWRQLLPKEAAYERKFSIERLSAFALTGGQIKIIIKNTAYKVAARTKPIFSTNDFVLEIKKELDSRFDGEKTLGFLE